MLAPKMLLKGDKEQLKDTALALLDKVGLKDKADAYLINYLEDRNKGLPSLGISYETRCFII